MKIRTEQSVIDGMKGKDLVELECEYCTKSFWHKKSLVGMVARGSIKSHALKFCSTKCANDSRKPILQSFNCLQCNGSFTRKPSQVRVGETKFCSRSCAATYNNSHAKEGRKFGPARETLNYCKICTVLISNSEFYCSKHKLTPMLERTIGTAVFSKDMEKRKKQILGDKTVLEAASSTAARPSRFASVRSNARQVANKYGIDKGCLICGYDTIVQICHIKAISDFPETAKISEVNGIDNLVGLCPNHHWELDHKKMSKTNLKKIANRNKKTK